MMMTSRQIVDRQKRRGATILEVLVVLFTAPAASPDWSGPYLEAEEALSDPWGRAYLYEPPSDNGNFKVESLGRDGVRGGSGEDLS